MRPGPAGRHVVSGKRTTGASPKLVYEAGDGLPVRRAPEATERDRSTAYTATCLQGNLRRRVVRGSSPQPEPGPAFSSIGGSDGMSLRQIDDEEVRRVQVLGFSKRRHASRLTTALLRRLHDRCEGLRGLPVECPDSGRPDMYAHASTVLGVGVPVEPHRHQRLDVADMTWRTFECAIKAASSVTIDLDRHLVATPRRPVVARLLRRAHPLGRVWYSA